jgi:hypothetical protein
VDVFEPLAPVSDGYAGLPVGLAFDWTDATRALGPGEWYLVAFRSVRRADADEDLLTEYDDRAHAEAAGSPGFVHYQKGPRAGDGSCLSFCLWTSRAEARVAAGRPNHVEAVALLDRMYERYTLEFLRVRGSGDGTPLSFEPYDRLPLSA